MEFQVSDLLKSTLTDDNNTKEKKQRRNGKEKRRNGKEK